MRLLILLQVVSLTLIPPAVGVQEGPEQATRYDVIMYAGVPPESYPEEARKELKPEKPLLSIRVEAGVKFHAEGNGSMFEGRLLSVRDGKAELRMEKSRLHTTSCTPIAVTMKLNEAASSGGCIFSSIVFLYYFRVKSINGGDRERLEEGGTPNNGMQRTRKSAALVR
jgi:hypothetical protein